MVCKTAEDVYVPGRRISETYAKRPEDVVLSKKLIEEDKYL